MKSTSAIRHDELYLQLCTGIDRHGFKLGRNKPCFASKVMDWHRRQRLHRLSSFRTVTQQLSLYNTISWCCIATGLLKYVEERTHNLASDYTSANMQKRSGYSGEQSEQSVAGKASEYRQRSGKLCVKCGQSRC